jgi:hypothetical protein
LPVRKVNADMQRKQEFYEQALKRHEDMLGLGETKRHGQTIAKRRSKKGKK